MNRIRKPPSVLEKKARKGFRGFPVATIAFYGPDDRRATKVAVGIIEKKGGEPIALERWSSDEGDIRLDRPIGYEIISFMEKHGARSMVMGGRIMGCPHEEGIDYPAGAYCPKCPFWAGRNRFTGEMIH